MSRNQAWCRVGNTKSAAAAVAAVFSHLLLVGLYTPPDARFPALAASCRGNWQRTLSLDRAEQPHHVKGGWQGLQPLAAPTSSLP
jgi:hypothetical protein